MANLKDLRNRINSIRATQKITSAMKLVAGVKFRKSEEEVKGSRPYSFALNGTIKYLCSCRYSLGKDYPVFTGHEKESQDVAVVVYASDKGLCGNFNSNIIKSAVSHIKSLIAHGAIVNLTCVGTKITNVLSKHFPNIKIDSYTFSSFNNNDGLKEFSKKLLSKFHNREISKVYLMYTHFHTAISNELRISQVLPVLDEDDSKPDNFRISQQIPSFDVPEENFINELAEHNLQTQLRQAWKESSASENGTRMTAMDNATKNAQDMLDKLILTYNRTRQAVITGELIEVISGAEAL